MTLGVPRGGAAAGSQNDIVRGGSNARVEAPLDRALDSLGHGLDHWAAATAGDAAPPGLGRDAKHRTVRGGSDARTGRARPDARAERSAKLPQNRRSAGATIEIRLTMARDVGKATFVDALAEQIAPRCPTAAQSDAFSAAILGGLAEPVANKSTMILRLQKTGVVDVVAESGAVVASVPAPEVADALLDVYVGPAAVSPAARDAIAAGLAAF